MHEQRVADVVPARSGTARATSAYLHAACAAGQAVGAGLPFYAGVAASGAQLAWQIGAVDLDSQADCLAKFGSNKWHGAALFSGIVLDRLLA